MKAGILRFAHKSIWGLEWVPKVFRNDQVMGCRETGVYETVPSDTGRSLMLGHLSGTS